LGDIPEKQSFVVPNNQMAQILFGRNEEHLKAMERQINGIQIVARGNELLLSGDPAAVQQTQELLSRLLALLNSGHELTSQDVFYALRMVAEGRQADLAGLHDNVVVTTARGKKIKPKSIGQKEYVRAIRDNGIVFGIGPAGTGKTYLAMAMAIAAFKERRYERIILTRPAVEAGEKLGFLPGDLQEKVDPYLRPLYDALYDILGTEHFDKYMGRGRIEVAPLAYMRGRTLDDSFVILDEAQNTTPEQMKMFLTRLGFGSKAVVTGDVTQIDLPPEKWSGLEQVQRILQNIDGISFVHLSEKDVVRHPLVQRIIQAYERYDKHLDDQAGE